MFNVLTANLVLSTLIFWAIARIYVLPQLNRENSGAFIIPILLLHTSRHLGLMFLSPGATMPGMPDEFALPAAIGDLIAAALAAVGLVLVLAGLRSARSAIWLFNLWGLLDLVTAIALATFYEAEQHMGAAYWIPAFWVPALLVTHYVTFIILTRHWRADGNNSTTRVQGGKDEAPL